MPQKLLRNPSTTMTATPLTTHSASSPFSCHRKTKSLNSTILAKCGRSNKRAQKDHINIRISHSGDQHKGDIRNHGSLCLCGLSGPYHSFKSFCWPHRRTQLKPFLEPSFYCILRFWQIRCTPLSVYIHIYIHIHISVIDVLKLETPFDGSPPLPPRRRGAGAPRRPRSAPRAWRSSRGPWRRSPRSPRSS